jgi:hypothetical protein
MDQLHGAHDNGRAANAPAQTRDLTEHRAAQINDRKNTTEAINGQGARGTQGPAVFESGKETGKETVSKITGDRDDEGHHSGGSLQTLETGSVFLLGPIKRDLYRLQNRSVRFGVGISLIAFLKRSRPNQVLVQHELADVTAILQAALRVQFSSR